MTLPSSGPLTMTAIAKEAGVSTTALSLNNSSLRALANKPTLNSNISYSDFYGKNVVTNGFVQSTAITPIGGDFSVLSGWTVFTGGIVFLGSTVIAGWTSPNPGTLQNALAVNSGSAFVNTTGSVPVGMPFGSNSIQVYTGSTVHPSGSFGSQSTCYSSYTYTNALQLFAGDTIYVSYNATAGLDWYSAVIYLLNTANGAATFMFVGNGDGSTGWVQTGLTVGSTGTYSVVAVSGTRDYTGGTVGGAFLEVTNAYVVRA